MPKIFLNSNPHSAFDATLRSHAAVSIFEDRGSIFSFLLEFDPLQLCASHITIIASRAALETFLVSKLLEL